jgi:O-antigen ligase
VHLTKITQTFHNALDGNISDRCLRAVANFPQHSRSASPTRTEPGRGGFKPPLHPLEIALLCTLAVHLCFLPWALGTMHLWSQTLSLALSLLEFALALLPRRTDSLHGPTSAVAIAPFRRLVAFPIFWAGAMLLAYVAVQGLNPAWRYRTNADIWWLEPTNHFSWLPSGVAAPLARSNSWAVLMIFASVWLTVCAIWTGLLRRKSYRVLCAVLASNAGVLGVIGLMQIATHSKRIFWSYVPSNEYFVASFIYPNHGGAYFNLIVGLVAGCAWWYFGRAPRDHASPWLIALFTGAGFAAAGIVLLSYSRMSSALLALFLVLAALAAGLALALRPKQAGPRASLAPFLLAIAGIVALGLVAIATPRGWQRFSPLLLNPGSVIDDRAQLRAATADMLADRWLLGWGAGSFRYAFPLYARKYSALNYAANGDRLYWEHAHDDLLEFPAELGLLGLLPLGFGLGFFARRLAKARFWQNPVSLTVVTGCVLTLAHAWMDFVFQNPAVLTTWAVLLVAALRWAELDQPALRRNSGSPHPAPAPPSAA